MWDGVEILIDASNAKMSDKINFGFSAYESLETNPNRITVFEDADGHISGVYK